MVEGKQTLIGTFQSLLSYLVKSHSKLSTVPLDLYPDEYSLVVDGVVRWFDCVMKPCTTKLIKMVVGPKALNKQPFP